MNGRFEAITPLDLNDTMTNFQHAPSKDFRIKRQTTLKAVRNSSNSNYSSSSEEPMSIRGSSDEEISTIAAGELVLEYGEK